ncbi:MAG: hypothetical protein MZV64_74245 [Ignavibacteriales bacterium]|nr:hypothetical protein [Ignavibacteriales bacterium]
MISRYSGSSSTTRTFIADPPFLEYLEDRKRKKSAPPSRCARHHSLPGERRHGPPTWRPAR